jgi:DNA-binding GntR family transcriptional regulator
VSRLADLEREIATTDDPEALQSLTVAFNAMVVDAAGSSRVKVVLRALSQLVPGSFFELVPGAVDVERRGLRAIVKAVQDGDPDRAAEEYSRMMRAVGVEVVQLLSERGLFDVHEEPGVGGAGGTAAESD